MLTFFTLYCIFGITVVIYCIFTKLIFGLNKFKIYESKSEIFAINIDFIFEVRDLWIFLYWNKLLIKDSKETLELCFGLFPTLIIKISIIRDIFRNGIF